METITFSKILVEDLDIGDGTRSLRLQDGALYNLNRVHLGTLLLTRTQTLNASAAAAVLTASGLFLAGARIFGVTIEVLTAFGATNGLTGLAIGYAADSTAWGNAIALTLGTKTSQADFLSGALPIFATATDALVTALGGTFDATGQLQVKTHYMMLRH